MRSNKSDIYYVVLIGNRYYQPVPITFDVEHNPVVCYKAGILIYRFDIYRGVPARTFHIMEPGLQGNRGIWAYFPKFPKDSPADDPHE
jgi:hypothetical protein